MREKLLLKIEKLMRNASRAELEEVRQYLNHLAEIKSLKIDSTNGNGIYRLNNGDMLYDANDKKYREENI